MIKPHIDPELFSIFQEFLETHHIHARWWHLGKSCWQAFYLPYYHWHLDRSRWKPSLDYGMLLESRIVSFSAETRDTYRDCFMTTHNITLFLLILGWFVGTYGLVFEYLAAPCLRSDIIETTREKKAGSEKKEKHWDRSEQAVGKDTESMQKRKWGNKSYSYHHSNDADVWFRNFEWHTRCFGLATITSILSFLPWKLKGSPTYQ